MSFDADTSAPQGALAAARATLTRVFGHPAFRGLQEEVVGHVLAGGDALAVLPTGGGKSVCYQIPALERPGVGLVVSPLIALMTDQVAALRAAGVRAARLDSSLSARERGSVLDAIGSGGIDLIYVAPEALASGWLLDRMRQVPLSLIAIDEAHCVSQWGHDFRPDYRRLAVLAEAFPGVPRVALTATADSRTRADIREQLGLAGAREFVASFDRPNLVLNASRKDGNTAATIARLARARQGQCGIVYCTSRKSTEEMAASLSGQGLRAIAYHAGLPGPERAELLDRFQREDDVVVCATVAFGMGIDKPDVRYVIHADPPKSIEAYWQEVGRAGRDGEMAEGFAFYGPSDRRIHAQRIDESTASDEVKLVQRNKLNQLFALFESLACRRAGVRAYFGEAGAEPCGVCDACKHQGEAHDGTEPARMALSAVVRCEERLGRQRLINHLTGTEPDGPLEKVFSNRSTYGIGRGLTKVGWRRVLDQLVFEGVLSDEPVEGYTLLRIAEPDRARALLRGEARLLMRESPTGPTRLGRDEKAARRADRTAKANAEAAALGPSGERLFQALRGWRLKVAGELRLPPYTIFHDSTLRAIATANPGTLEALAAIPGIGEAKLARFGAAVIDVVGSA
jgi:ATP-dependent DNA helicase RecQ